MKKIALNLTILSISLIVSILFAEGIVRIFKLSYVLENTSDQFFESVDGIGYFGKKNIEGIWSTPEFRIKIKHNSMGFRDDEHFLNKKNRIKRIIVLGDSFTWGWGIDKNDVFTEKLESKLQNTEVINMGIPGSGIAQEYIILKEYALKFNPDIVILGFFLDDFLSKKLLEKIALRKIYWNKRISKTKFITYSEEKAYLSGNQYLKVPYISVGQQIIYNQVTENIKEKVLNNFFLTAQKFLRSHSALFNFIATKIKTTEKLEWLRKIFIELGGMKKLPDISIVASQALKLKDQWEYTGKALLKMKDLAERHDFKLIVVIIPEKPQVYKKFWSMISSQHNISADDLDLPNRFIKETCEQNNIYVLDLLPEFRKYADKGENLYFDYDPHWNSRGHEVAGELIYDYINKIGI